MMERYILPEIGDIWKEEQKYRHWLDVELSACEARTASEDLPEEILNDLYRYAKFDFERVKLLEADMHDEYKAFLKNVSESLGDDFQYMHRDITDVEVQDICLSMQMRDSTNVMLDKLSQVRAAVGDKARKYKNTLCIGRVNGVHAEPTSFGLKMATWYAELSRTVDRLKNSRDEVSFGKVSGAVGTLGNREPNVEQYVCMNAGLQVSPAAGAMLPRDGHAQYMTTLAILAGTLEKFAAEIRTLQSSEFLELEEPYHTGRHIPMRIPFRKDAKFSTTILALARVVRSNAMLSLENISQWHEGDDSILESERLVIAESTILCYYMLELLLEIMQGLCVREDRMLENLNRLGGLIFAEKLADVLKEKGVGKDKAEMIAKNYAENSIQDGIDYKTAVSENIIVKDKLTAEEFETLFDYSSYIQNADVILKRCGL